MRKLNYLIKGIYAKHAKAQIMPKTGATSQFDTKYSTN